MAKLDASAPPDVSSKRALDLVLDLMAIPGKSCQESRVAEYITSCLRQAGVPESAIAFDNAAAKSPAGGEIGNLFVKLPGTVRAPRRLLMAHIDTVPLCVGARPVRKGNVIASRDAHTALGADDRAGAAVLLNAALEIRRRKLPHPPLTFFWPVQEEIGLYGVRFASLNKLGNPKLCFNWDGNQPYIATIGATGDYVMHIDIEGVASHAGVHPERGVSAAAVAALAVADLVRDGWHGLIVKRSHTGTSNIGMIHGGEATNVVMPQLTLRAEARSHNPQFRSEIVAAFRKAFERAAETVKSDTGRTARVLFEADLKYESFLLSEDEPCVQAALSAIRAVGLEPETRVSNGGLDANWLTARGLPSVTLGCGQQDVHTTDETLHIDSYLQACRIGLALATAA